MESAMTHDAHQPFLEAICAAIHDDAPRLQYADWLEENGNETRAEFIRVQVELARLPPCPELSKLREKFESLYQGTQNAGRALIMPAEPTRGQALSEWVLNQFCSCRVCQLSLREQELFGAVGDPVTEWRNWAVWAGKLIVDITGETIPIFRRGFVAEITLPCEQWLAHRETLLRTVPLEKVTLTHCTTVSITGPSMTFDAEEVDCLRHQPEWPANLKTAQQSVALFNAVISPSDHNRNQPVVCRVQNGGLLLDDVSASRVVHVQIEDRRLTDGYAALRDLTLNAFGISAEIIQGTGNYASMPQGLINYPTRRRR